MFRLHYDAAYAMVSSMASALSEPDLHEYLWTVAGPSHIIRIKQTEWAKKLAVSKFTLNRALQSMSLDGRLIKHHGAGGSASIVYTVEDPRPFDW